MVVCPLVGFDFVGTGLGEPQTRGAFVAVPKPACGAKGNSSILLHEVPMYSPGWALFLNPRHAFLLLSFLPTLPAPTLVADHKLMALILTGVQQLLPDGFPGGLCGIDLVFFSFETNFVDLDEPIDKCSYVGHKR